MAWEKRNNGYAYVDSCGAELIIENTPGKSMLMSFDGWYTNDGTLLELATALLDLRQEVYGKKVLLTPYDEDEIFKTTITSRWDVEKHKSPTLVNFGVIHV